MEQWFLVLLLLLLRIQILLRLLAFCFSPFFFLSIFLFTNASLAFECNVQFEMPLIKCFYTIGNSFSFFESPHQESSLPAQHIYEYSAHSNNWMALCWSQQKYKFTIFDLICMFEMDKRLNVYLYSILSRAQVVPAIYSEGKRNGKRKLIREMESLWEK